MINNFQHDEYWCCGKLFDKYDIWQWWETIHVQPDDQVESCGQRWVVLTYILRRWHKTYLIFFTTAQKFSLFCLGKKNFLQPVATMCVRVCVWNGEICLPAVGKADWDSRSSLLSPESCSSYFDILLLRKCEWKFAFFFDIYISFEFWLKESVCVIQATSCICKEHFKVILVCFASLLGLLSYTDSLDERRKKIIQRHSNSWCKKFHLHWKDDMWCVDIIKNTGQEITFGI